MNIEIGKLALGDIDSIWLYTKEQWSEEQANRYYDLLLDEIEHLAQFPESGKTAEAVRQGYRYSKVKSHLIFYKVDHLQDKLEIIRVLHERMDSSQWLGE